jgi:hypothetical protein
MLREKVIQTLPGGFMLVLLVIALPVELLFGISFFRSGSTIPGVAAIVAAAITAIMLAGLFVVNPNEAKVVQLFGNYVGSVRRAGFHWINPLTSRTSVSMRIRNFESAKLKVNDLVGNPIEIAAVVVWKVVDSAEAVFEVDDYKNFVQVQSEAALRNMATGYAYDAHDVEGELALRSHTTEIADRLRHEIQERLSKAGVEVLEARISHLAYAPEIASAMLQRQQASAIVAARTRIVEGAVGMVEMALDELSKRGMVDLDPERRAAMVTNLLVVLCGDRHPQPVVNAGTLYH